MRLPLAGSFFPTNLPPKRLTVLRILINAIATLAEGVVLFAFPGAIPSVGIVLAPHQAFVAWLLGADVAVGGSLPLAGEGDHA